MLEEPEKHHKKYYEMSDYQNKQYKSFQIARTILFKQLKELLKA